MNILFLGAHPDDNVVKAGGTAIKYSKEGHNVFFVDVTTGNLGKVKKCQENLGNIRIEESKNAASLIKAEYNNLGFKDCNIRENDEELIKKYVELIRKLQPDIIFTHPPEDYHNDHINLGSLVTNHTYSAKLPEYMPNSTALEKSPFIVYTYSTDMNFDINPEFRPDLIVGINDVIDIKKAMLSQYISQDSLFQKHFKKSLVTRILEHNKQLAEKYEKNIKKNSNYAEVFKICYTARIPTEKDIEKFFLNAKYIKP